MVINIDKLVDIFNKTESTLIKCGILPKTIEEAREQGIIDHQNIVERFKTNSDDDFFFHMSKIIFYSGFNQNTVNNKSDCIKKYFGSYKKTASYGDADIREIMSDKDMIKNKNKIASVIKNAKEFMQLVEKYGSYRNYLLSFGDTYPLKEEETDKLKGDLQSRFYYIGSMEEKEIDILKDDLQSRFHYVGPATVYHLLIGYGFFVLKPDRMVMRVLHRTHLISSENEEDFSNAINVGRDIAKALNLPICYIDSVLVSLGQVGEANICLASNPKCYLCELQKICNFL